MRRKSWAGIVALVLAILLADSLYWRFTQQRLEAGLQQFVDDARRTGWEVRTVRQAAGGWPTEARLTLDQVQVTGARPDLPEGMSWTADQLVLRVSLWRPWTLAITANTEQQIQFGKGPVLKVHAQALEIDVNMTGDGHRRTAQLHAQDLRAGPFSGPLGTSDAKIGLIDMQLGADPTADSNQQALHVGLSAEAVSLPAVKRWPLGPLVSSVTLDGSLTGPLTQAGGLTASATAWREAGGSAEIKKFTLGWGPLGLTATATIALDDELQPMGAGTSKLVGYAASLDTLASAGVLSRSAATAAKAVLSLLGTTPAEGESSEVDVPLTLQYRTLSMRQVPLIRLPELDWPSR